MRPVYDCVIIIFFSFFSLVSGFANSGTANSQFKFRSVTIDNGLPNNRTTGATKDARGFVWFATDDGICRFDGLSTRNYDSYSGHQDEEFDQQFTSIYAAKSGHLLAGAYHLFRFNYETDKLELIFKDDSTDQPFRTRAIIEDENNTIWIGARNGIFNMDSDFQLNHLPPDTNENHYEVWDLIKVENKLWIGSRSNGVLVYDLVDSTYTRVPLFNEVSEPVNVILSLFHDHEIIWVGTKNNGIFKINKRTYEVISHEFPDVNVRRIRDIKRDKNNNLWLGTMEGLYLVASGSEEYFRYAYKFNTVSDITHNSVFNVLIDDNEIMWLSTYAGGINYTDLNKKRFHLVEAKDGDNNFLNNSIVSGFCVDKDNNVYIGTDHGGLNFWNRKTNKFTYFPHGPGSISGTNIKCMVSDSQGNIWIGTYEGGISCYMPEKKEFKYYYADPADQNSLQSNIVYSLAIDKEENIWVGTRKGVDLLDTRSGQIHRKYSSESIHIVYIDQNDSIWMGIDGVDLFYYEAKRDSFKRCFDSIRISSPGALLRDSENHLWVGTKNGIIVIDLTSRQLYHYDKNKGLSSNIVFGFLEDESKNIWVSSSSGLMKLIGAASGPENFEIKVYSIEDGLQSNQFWRNSAYKSDRGEMFFGGVNGFNCFYPNNIQDNTYEPVLAISDLKILNKTVSINQELNGQVVLDKSINEKDELILNHKQKVFTLDFVALHFANAKKNRYKYMLFPFEQEWNYTEYPRNSATYTSLPAGKYVFKLSGSNSDGIWQSDILELRIRIKPPLWKTWWFISIVFILMIASLIFLFNRRLHLIQKQKHYLEQQVDQRTRHIEEQTVKLKELNNIKDKLFSVIAHDLKNPFQTIMGFSELLKIRYHNYQDNQRLKYIDMIYESAQRFYKLLENLLSWSRSQTGTVPYKPKPADMKKLVDQVIHLLEHETDKKEIVISNEINQTLFLFIDKQMIFSVVNNLISNAIKFTNSKGQIQIKSVTLKEMAVISISDNGIGMSREEIDNLFRLENTTTNTGTSGETGTGLGLLICKDFVEKNNGKIWVESTPDKGTTFYLSLPLAHEV